MKSNDTAERWKMETGMTDRRSGSVSVLLTCLMAVVISVFLLLYSHASEETLKSTVDWNGRNAGNSVLSYYLPRLSDRYDIYGTWSEKTILQWRMEQYVNANSPFWNGEQNSGMLQARLEALEVDAEGWSMMEPKQWKQQIISIMEDRAVVDALESLQDIAMLAGEGVERKEGAEVPEISRSGSRERSEKNERGESLTAENAEENTDASTEEPAEEESLLDKKMAQMNREADRRQQQGQALVDSVTLNDGRALTDPVRITALPSKQREQAEMESSWDVLCSDPSQLGAVIRNSFYTDLYIMEYFGHYRDQRDGWFLCDLEYILQGKLSDEENFRKTKQDLFLLRTALNLAAIHRNDVLEQAIGAMAAAVAPVPYPLAFGLIAASVSAAEAGSDVKALLKGEAVPLLKSAEQWNVLGTDGLETAGIGTENYSENGGVTEGGLGGEMDYENYLRLLLLLRPQNTKILRIMDLVQLDLSRELGEDFTLAECCSGFQWTMETTLRNSAGKEWTYRCEGNSSYR